jgi:hypothetical protein
MGQAARWLPVFRNQRDARVRALRNSTTLKVAATAASIYFRIRVKVGPPRMAKCLRRARVVFFRFCPLVLFDIRGVCPSRAHWVWPSRRQTCDGADLSDPRDNIVGDLFQ